jgi:phospholipid/cholesterol/gamma-HCH transport system substrate-binding protein
MIKYRGAGLIRSGFIGVVLAVLVILVGLSPEQLWARATTVRYQALFSEAGGLAVGNKIKVSGVTVGGVTDIALQRGDALVTFNVDGSVVLGNNTTAQIRTGSLLGERVITLESTGSAPMRPLDVIPLSRTGSPYSLTEAVSDLTANAAGTKTDTLNQSLDTLSSTLDQVAPELGPTFEGLTRFSRAINDRDETLSDLFRSARDVTGVLSERSQQVNTLILNANDLLEVLVNRRQAIVELLSHTTVLAQQLKGFIADNEQKLAPTLEKLNSVTAMLEKNRDNIAKALPGVAKAALTSAESVSSGPYYQAFVPNFLQANLLQPFLDYAFGFRRGTDAGQPPDNAGPRAVIPIPRNAIPAPAVIPAGG